MNQIPFGRNNFKISSYNKLSMKKHLVIMLFFLFSTVIVFSQTNPKPAVKKPLPLVEKLLTGSDLPYKMINDSLAVIPYEGANIPSYQVLVQAIGDLLIVFTNLSETLPGRIDETNYKYLLQKNDHFDVVKIGMSAEDNIMYLRADLYKSGTNGALLKRVITQVANVTNIIGGDLK